MKHEERDDGMVWLDRIFRRIAREAGLQVDEAGWLDPCAEDRSRGVSTYRARVGGKEVSIPFETERLAGALTDPSVRIELEARIAKALEAASSGRS